ncbi:increased DNA methylation 2-like protein [Cinnamomum micranthum f. kanehirae]|uniref:Increased DNA methylation 2-like protein n=1 Tax=Cinnamomum micranthum f. kanehirae TaxID=337451 RepID=A0A3S3R366_9MAGN|nr:increased DNA methylation 2-like protein [Cinnamomum micranthum f. kanehirae]
MRGKQGFWRREREKKKRETETETESDGEPAAAPAVAWQVQVSNTSLASPSSRLPNWMEMTADQRFLLLFIFSHYFGPDLKDERPRKSVFQRIVEGLPPYATHELAGSRIRTLEVERVYYYVLRMAKKFDIVERETLHKFLNYGYLHSPSQDSNADLGQFPDLFPLHLHRQYRFEEQYQVIENIVFINNLNTSFINTVVATRFKNFTGLEFLFLDAEAALSYCRICGIADNMIEELHDGSLLRALCRDQEKWEWEI